MAPRLRISAKISMASSGFLMRGGMPSDSKGRLIASFSIPRAQHEVRACRGFRRMETQTADAPADTGCWMGFGMADVIRRHLHPRKLLQCNSCPDARELTIKKTGGNRGNVAIKSDPKIET